MATDGEKFEDQFIHFDRIHERDRHTDTHTQTPHDHIGRAALAQHRAAKMNSAYEHGIYVRLHVRVCVLVSVR